MANTRYTRAIEQAAQTCGGYAELARRIGVSVEDVARWASGEAEPTPTAFIAVSDIVLGSTLKLRRRTLLTGRDAG